MTTTAADRSAVPGQAPAGVATHCPYCALQCGMTLTVADRTTGLPSPRVQVQPRASAAGLGRLCQKGWSAAELLEHPERLRTPLLREVPGDRTSRFVPSGWDEALDVVAAGIRAAQVAHGRDAVAVFGGGGLTNEKAYALGKLARVALRTSQVDYNGRFCMSSAAAAANAALGVDRGLPFPVRDLVGTGVLVLLGSNPAETMPPFMAHVQAVQEAGGTVVVVDPRRTPTAAAADVHVQPLPGSDMALLLGLLHVVLRDGLEDAAYVAGRTRGIEELRAAARRYWPERVERLTGVPAGEVGSLARLVASHAPVAGGRGAVLLTARGSEQHATGTDTVLAAIDLALVLGLPGRPHAGYGCLTGQGNGQGGREHGLKADQLPGYRSISDPAARAHVAGVWGVDPASLPGPGRSAYELLDACGRPDGPRVLLLAGSNPVVSAPRAGHVSDRLAALDLLVVTDLVMSETAAVADVVLPTTMWAEEDGTMTTLEGRVVRRRKAVDAPVGCRTDLQVLAGLADRLGAGTDFPADAFPAAPRLVFEELRRASAGGRADYSHVGWDAVAADGSDGVHWGSPRMFVDRFPTADGRAVLHAVEHRALVEDVDAEFPWLLTTGRVLAQYQSGAQTRRVPSLVRSAPSSFVEVHPVLAAAHGIGDGDLVRVTSRHGVAEAPARLTPTVRTDTVFMPFHWGGAGRANSLTPPALDPTSRMPEFKACAVRLERAAPVRGMTDPEETA
ncbi:molybdopterin oxidoreductase family protein [Aquipuribacter hungaricus]|uniref:Molybdopterin oxidoreductase family protein n=1 Tax=Aquipuribacter hungaricus TaxID=545624 RepID=A0ABV7WHZ2_9MICO